ncbi:hypothetical protein N8553_01530 [bacterium]|nr:hypothetical protein [Planctomicrobium sp.]MDA7503645.1 hypothetical protein [bacterium]
MYHLFNIEATQTKTTPPNEQATAIAVYVTAIRKRVSNRPLVEGLGNEWQGRKRVRAYFYIKFLKF